MRWKDAAADTGSEFGFNESFVESAGRSLRQCSCENICRGEVRVRPSHDVIRDSDHRDIPDASEHYLSLTVLRRFFGVRVVQLSLRARNRAEVLLNVLECLPWLKAPRDNDHRVVGLVEPLVELLEVFNGNPFDVSSIADRRLAVVVPVVGGRGDTLSQNSRWTVLAPLELVSHDCHFGSQVLTLDVAVHHAISFHLDAELKVLVC